LSKFVGFLVTKLFIINIFNFRDYQKAVETAFQSKNIEQLDTVELKALRQPELLEQIRAYKTKLGYR